MSDYEFILPWPPSVNGYWRSVRGRQIISKRGREYRKLVCDMFLEDGFYHASGMALTERLSVSVILHPPTLRKYDIDNWCKAPFDAITHAGFWEDDEQVDRLSILKAEKIKSGKVIMKITVLD